MCRCLLVNMTFTRWRSLVTMATRRRTYLIYYAMWQHYVTVHVTGRLSQVKPGETSDRAHLVWLVCFKKWGKLWPKKYPCLLPLPVETSSTFNIPQILPYLNTFLTPKLLITRHAYPNRWQQMCYLYIIWVPLRWWVYYTAYSSDHNIQIQFPDIYYTLLDTYTSAVQCTNYIYWPVINIYWPVITMTGPAHCWTPTVNFARYMKLNGLVV